MSLSDFTFYGVLAAIVIVVAAGPLLERKTFTSMFEVEQIADNVYVGREMPQTDRDKFLQNYATARDKVAAFFGRDNGEPRVVACSSWSCWERVGGEKPSARGILEHGAAYGKKFFRISPLSVRNVKTVIHEYTHIEIAYRIGLRRKFGALPVWFNEGLASVVADEKIHSEEAYKKMLSGGVPPKITEVTSSGQWGRGGGNIRNSYIAAAHEVRLWMKQAGGRAAVVELLDRLGQGEDFDRVFRELGGERPRS